MPLARPYGFRYPFDILTAMQAWRKKLGEGPGGNYDPSYDEVIKYLTDRDRALEDHLNLDVAQGVLGLGANGSSFDFGVLEVDIPGDSVTVTVPSGRELRIDFHVHVVNNDFVNPGGNNTVRIRVYRGTTLIGFRSFAGIADSANTFAEDEADIDGTEFDEPTAGTHVYKITAEITHGPSQNMTISGGASFISVDDIGPAARFNL